MADKPFNAIDVRLRNRISDGELDQKKGKILTPGDVNFMATGPLHVRKPNGQTLFIYVPGALPKKLREDAYPTLHELRAQQTNNRGLASGTERIAPDPGRRRSAPGNRTIAKTVSSAIIGAFDPAGPKQYCRLTAWTGKETDQFEALFPTFQEIAKQMRARAPERWRAQQDFADRTEPEWVIPGTPFTTITVNNSYPTGVHTDKGDLDEGISVIGCWRRGEFTGGWLCFPRYRVGVDLQDGDLIFMDAHEWHGNTPITCACGKTLAGICPDCQAERISIVCYYRTKMEGCGSLSEEETRRMQLAEKRAVAVGE